MEDVLTYPTKSSCLTEPGGVWWEFTVDWNVLVTAWVTFLKAEEADNLPAAL